MGKAWVHVSPELLRQALGAPDSAQIIGALWIIVDGRDRLDLLFESPDLRENLSFPILTPTVTRRGWDPDPLARMRWDWNHQ